MPPVEFDTIPRFASESTTEGKASLDPSNYYGLQLGAFEPIITRSKGTTPEDLAVIEDVEVPEVDSEDETTVHKLLKDYSEAESEDDSDYVPSEDSEVDEDSTSNDFVITRSKGITPQEFGIVQDVEIPEIESEDETTIDKIMKDYSDGEEASDDSDYAPSEASDDDLEFDSDASISDDEFVHEDIEDVVVPKVHFTRRAIVIQDVKIPAVSNAIVQDSPVGHVDNDAFSELAAIANNIVQHAAGNSFVQAAIKTLDFGLDFCEKIVAPVSTHYKEHVQGVRRHLRAVRRSGSGSKTGLFAYCVEFFKVNWFLSFIGMTLTVGTDSSSEKWSTGRKSSSQEYSDDDESTVYKLMKEYDSQDDEDYVPSDCSEDSMEFDSDSSDDETTVDKLMKDYSETEDFDYVPCSESEDDSLECDSDAEVSEDSDCDSSDVEDCSEEETTVDKLMKDYSDEESDFDADYIPGEEVEEDIEFHSDASVTETEESETEVESEEEVAADVECDELEIVDESASQDDASQDDASQDDASQDAGSEDDEVASQDAESEDDEE